MKIFLDSADVNIIKEYAQSHLVDGVTTNPSLIAQTGKDFKETIHQICQIVNGPVSAEVTARDAEGMVKEGKALSLIHPNVTVKVPLTFDGLRACYELRRQGISVNVTLCFSVNQSILAAKAGASFISPFMGRIDDLGYDGAQLIDDIVSAYRRYPDFQTKILAASIRTPNHIYQAALSGADVITIPPRLFTQMYQHPLTDKGLDSFLNDWKSTGQSIIS